MTGRRRLHFKLRTLFILVTLAGIACFWFVHPTAVANRVVSSVNHGELASFDSLLVSDRTWATDAQLQDIQLQLQPLTFLQAIRGERWFLGYVPRGEKMEGYDWHLLLRVTYSGVEPVLLLH